MQDNHTIFSITPETLSRLGPQAAVETFRDLLWCEARRQRVPVNKVRITSEITTADGGVDASIDDDVPQAADDTLVVGGTRYQIKTGRVKPWQESWLRQELFGKSTSTVSKENLGAAVRRCLEDGGRYVIVCFGTSPDSEQIALAKNFLVQMFRQCGYEAAQVDVWGQEALIGLLSKYPSLCLWVSGRDGLEFRSHASWRIDNEMGTALKLGPQQQQLIEEIQQCLRTEAIRHVRLIGEPGLGKTRLVLEATSAQDVAPTVVYVPNAEDFQRSALFNAVLRADNDFHVVLVVDECPERERASIWNALKRRSERCRLITIDHGPETTSDEMMKIIQCPALPKEHIAEIIGVYVPGSDEIERWAVFCDGSPRVAHAVALNLQRNPDDMLRPPATVDLWGRFIDGFERSGTQESRHRHLVLRHVALFDRFGFEHPVDKEAKFVAALAEQADPTLTWGQFQSTVSDLKRRRILQGKTTLFIAPKALHVHLWVQFWEHHGRGISLEELLIHMPETLRRWFIEMFHYGHLTEVASRHVEQILGPGGLLSENSKVPEADACKFINHLAEAAPKAALQCLERTVGRWSGERLSAFFAGRQDIVWALEKIAVWRDTFVGAASVLLRLAEFENARHSNNSTGVFVGLFTISDFGPLSPTEASPARRLPSLLGALDSPSKAVRAIGLNACSVALTTHSGFKVIGPEHQGLRPRADLWMPSIWAEVFDGYRAVWEAVVDAKCGWSLEERSHANKVLIDAAKALVHCEAMWDLVLTTLEGLVGGDIVDLKALLGFVTYCRRHLANDMPQSLFERIQAIDAAISGATLEARIRRLLVLSSWDDDFEDGKRSEKFSQKVEALATEILGDIKVLRSVVRDLVRGENHHLYEFGRHLAKHADTSEPFDVVKTAYLEATPARSTTLLGGFLYGMRERDRATWEKALVEMISDVRFAGQVGDLIWRSGLSEVIFDHVIAGVDCGRLSLAQLRMLSHNRDIRLLNSGRIASLLKRLTTSGDHEAASLALVVTDSYYCEKPPQTLPEAEVYKLLVGDSLFDGAGGAMDDHHWGVVAQHFVEQYPNRCIDLFHELLMRFEMDRIARRERPSTTAIMDRIIEKHPSECWKIVGSLSEDVESRRAVGIWFWLEPTSYFGEHDHGRVTKFPQSEVFAWASMDSDRRAPFLARFAPKFVSREGAGVFTRELLARYGHLEDVRRALWSNFGTEGWSGPASEHYRRKRDTARSWLEGENEPQVISWIEDYIDYLGRKITHAEIDEERGY